MEFYDFELLRSGRAHSWPEAEEDEKKREEREGGIKIQSGLNVFVGAVDVVVSSFLLSVGGMACGIYAQIKGNLAMLVGAST